MKQLLSFLFIIALSCNVIAQEQMIYKRVKIALDGKEMIDLAQTGIDVTEGIYKAGHALETDLSTEEIAKVEAAGFQLNVIIEDVSLFYSQRAASEAGIPITRDPSVEFPVPANWEYGSMGGFYTYAQVLEKLDFMAAQWPDLITVRAAVNPLTPSHLGNPIWWVKISDNPGVAEEEPQVLYTSLIHAREGIGVQQMIYFMLHLLENYDSDPSIQALVNSRELYFIPVANPDGYLYNQQTDPNGGGMWRKNRRNNGGSYGVDINRNFGYKWGIDNNGSSPNPSDLTYRGPSAFSEPETDNLRQFAESHNFKIALNYHSFSNLLLYPWGYTDEFCPDDAIFYAHATLMTRDNGYTIGPASTTIYPTNGGSDDYMYGDTQNKNAIFSYTPELGNDGDGFWPSTNRIIPLCQENMIQNMMAAYLSGSYGKLTDLSETIIGERSFYMPFKLQRLGFGESEGWEVSITPLDEHITSVGPAVEIGQLDIMEAVTDSVQITLGNALQSGMEFRFLLHLNNGEYVLTDTITKMFGTTSVVFEDDCDQIANWTSSSWGVTTSSFVSAPASISDSPFGEYNNDVNNIITLSLPIELPETPYANLSYWAKWDIESGWDYTQVLIKPAGTFVWTALSGKYTKAGNSNQLQGQPLYDGTSGWVREEIDLTSYAGTSFQLRFALTSDGSVTGDGFYFDDLKIVMLNVETGLADAGNINPSFRLYPNPASDVVNLETNNAFFAGELIEVVDLQGKTVTRQTVNERSNRFMLNAKALVPGVYFVKRSEQPQNPVRLVIQ